MRPSRRAFKDVIAAVSVLLSSWKFGTTFISEVARLANNFHVRNIYITTRKTSHFVGSAVITPALVQMPIVFTSGTMLYGSFGTKPGYTQHQKLDVLEQSVVR